MNFRKTETKHADGSSSTTTQCKGASLGDKENPCIEILSESQRVLKSGGKFENQLAVDVRVYTGSENPKVFSMVFANNEEFKTFISEIDGGNFE